MNMWPYLVNGLELYVLSVNNFALLAWNSIDLSIFNLLWSKWKLGHNTSIDFRKVTLDNYKLLT
jgi:hypothetical protein